jgi:hypothetical protein
MSETRLIIGNDDGNKFHPDGPRTNPAPTKPTNAGNLSQSNRIGTTKITNSKIAKVMIGYESSF